MAETNHTAPGFTGLVGRLVRTGMGAVQNRAELLAVEWQEEKARLMELLVWIIGVLFLALMGAMLLTATIIFLSPAPYRVWVTAGFALLYLLGSVGAWFAFKKQLQREPFEETLTQAKKDVAWLESFR